MSTTATPAPARAPNPNRDLPADQVVALFRRKLPRAMLAGLTADRTWLWWSGEKPDEASRAALVEIGFEFTPRDHPVVLRDGSAAVAHWFHSCGGYVKRGRGGRGKISKPAPDSQSKERAAPASSRPTAPRSSQPAPVNQRHDPLSARASESDAVSSFLRLAESIQ